MRVKRGPGRFNKGRPKKITPRQFEAEVIKLLDWASISTNWSTKE